MFTCNFICVPQPNPLRFHTRHGVSLAKKKGAKRSILIRAVLFIFENDEEIKMRETQHKKLI